MHDLELSDNSLSHLLVRFDMDHLREISKGQYVRRTPFCVLFGP